MSRYSRNSFFLRHQNVRDPAPFVEHRPAVQHDYDDGNGHPNDVIIGLGVGEHRIHQLEVIQIGDEQTAPGNVEEWRQDDVDCDNSAEIKG